MEQSIELMRKRHAYFTKMIAEHDIHTAKEFCEKFGETFEMFGVKVYTFVETPDTGIISITYEGYDYEDYTIHDGVDGGLARISNVVEWKPMCCHEEVDIFKVKEWEPPKFKNLNRNITKDE